MRTFNTFSAEETTQIGYKLGKLLKPGDVVCLHGDLGTGKTAFTGGIAKALDVQGYITSPTFTIVNEYSGSIPLFHFDVYRIADEEEMFEIGFQEYLEGNGAVVIEWAERIEAALPEALIHVQIAKELDKGVDARLIQIQFLGEKYRDYPAALDSINAD